MLAYQPGAYAAADELVAALERLANSDRAIKNLPSLLQVLAHIDAIGSRVRAHAARSLKVHRSVADLLELGVLPAEYVQDALLDDEAVQVCERALEVGLRLGQLSVEMRREHLIKVFNMKRNAGDKRLQLVDAYFPAANACASHRMLFNRLAQPAEREVSAKLGDAFRAWHIGQPGTSMKSTDALDQLCQQALAEAREVVACLADVKRHFSVSYDETTKAIEVVKQEPVSEEAEPPRAGPSRQRPRESDHLPFRSTTPEPPLRRLTFAARGSATPSASVFTPRRLAERGPRQSPPPEPLDAPVADLDDGAAATSGVDAVSQPRLPKKRPRSSHSGLPPSTGPEYTAASPGRLASTRLRPFTDDDVVRHRKKPRVTGPGRLETARQ